MVDAGRAHPHRVSRLARDMAPLTELERFLPAPNGGVMPRCQALSKRSGTQCRNPAVQGSDKCRMHGGGNRRQAEAGLRRPVGRPPIHGLYSRRGMKQVHELMAEVEGLGLDLDDTDRELMTLKAVLWFLLEQAQDFQGVQAELGQALAAATGVLDAAPSRGDEARGDLETMTLTEARQVARDLARAERLLGHIESWSLRLTEAAAKVITMVKVRAETRGKLAEARALAHFAELATAIRNIVWDIVPDAELLDVFEGRLRRELCGPHHLKLPEPTL